MIDYVEEIIPIEQSDPEFASLLEWWCNSGLTRKSIRIDDSEPPPEPIRVEKSVGRNEPCPCGSEKKYKRCCLKKG